MAKKEMTKEQEAMMEVYFKRYVDIGLCCDPIKRDTVEGDMVGLYGLLEYERPPIVMIMPGPTAAWFATCVVAMLDELGDTGNLKKKFAKWIPDAVAGRVDVKADGIVVDLADCGTEYKDILKRMIAHIPDADKIWSDVEEQSKTLVWPWIVGQYDAHLFAFYDFMRDEMGVTGYHKGYDVWRQTMNYGIIYTMKSACVVSERMTRAKMVDGKLHLDGAPACEFRDGTRVWALNGVRVPQWLSETPAMELDPKRFAEVKNVEIRREFVRKVGMERLLRGLKYKKIDGNDILVSASVPLEGYDYKETLKKYPDGKYEHYELLLVDLGEDVGKWPYLKFQNPSIGTWGMEAVPREIKTVVGALVWRNQCDVTPEVLT